MRFEQLRQFYEYMRSKSLVESGHKLFMTPQALYISLKRLEEELGIKFLARNANGMSLTPEGQRFYTFAIKTLDEYDLLLQDLERIKSESSALSGKLVIYSTMLFQRNIIPNVLKEFSAAYPHVRLNLFESDVANTYREFNDAPPPEGEGRLGFVQCPQPQRKLETIWHSSANYRFKKIKSGFYYGCTGPFLKIPPRASLKNLLKYPLVFYAASPITLEKGDSEIMNPLLLLLSEKHHVEITNSVNTLELWRQALIDRPCIGFIHNSLVEQNDPILEGLRLLNLREKIRSHLGVLCSRKHNRLEGIFISYVERYLKKLDLRRH